MKIEDQFRVAVPVETAWTVFLDVERIAPCMPGAQLEEVEGDEYRGVVKVKVGPITAQYKGAARILEADEAARRIVIKAEGRDTRGQGNASATVTVLLAADGADATQVSVDTDLNVTGKVAQFGRGVLADVSGKLLGQFVTCLEAKILSGDAAEPAEAPVAPALSVVPDPVEAPAAADGVRRIEGPEAEPVDLMAVAGGSKAGRLVKGLVAGLAVLFVWRRFRRRKQA